MHEYSISIKQTYMCKLSKLINVFFNRLGSYDMCIRLCHTNCLKKYVKREILHKILEQTDFAVPYSHYLTLLNVNNICSYALET